MPQLSSSSKRWLHRQKKDSYVQAAQKCGYRARSAFKLMEINEKYHIFRGVSRVMDLGSAPGGWSQVARSLLQPQAKIFAVDCLEMKDINGVSFKQGDITDLDFCLAVNEWLSEGKLDLVLSDIAPNISGISCVDQAKMFELVEMCADFCRSHLRKGGGFLVKVFQGESFKDSRELLNQMFSRVVVVKPKASRSDSTEAYLWCSDHC